MQYNAHLSHYSERPFFSFFWKTRGLLVSQVVSEGLFCAWQSASASLYYHNFPYIPFHTLTQEKFICNRFFLYMREYAAGIFACLHLTCSSCPLCYITFLAGLRPHLFLLPALGNKNDIPCRILLQILRIAKKCEFRYNTLSVSHCFNRLSKRRSHVKISHLRLTGLIVLVLVLVLTGSARILPTETFENESSSSSAAGRSRAPALPPGRRAPPIPR